MEAKSEKLSWWAKIGYGLGDIYGGGSGVVISFYYLIFLTDVVRIAPALAGTVILISKIYDSITDPFEGILADRTRTKLGRRRPYLLFGIPLVFLSFFALFYPFSMESETTRFVSVIAELPVLLHRHQHRHAQLQCPALRDHARLQRAFLAQFHPHLFLDRSPRSSPRWCRSRSSRPSPIFTPGISSWGWSSARSLPCHSSPPWWR